MCTDLTRFRLVATYDEAAADGVVILLAQHTKVIRERSESHSVGMPGQALVTHEQKLHRLVERNLALAQQLDACLGPDSPQDRLDGIRIDALRLGSLETGQDRAVGAVTDSC